MKKTVLVLLAMALAVAAGAQSLDSLDLFSIVTCPGEQADTQMRISWASDTLAAECYVTYTTERDSRWKKARQTGCDGRLCAVFDTVWSKKASGDNFHEDARFLKYDLQLDGLKPKTGYKYTVTYVAPDGSKKTSDTYHFKTAGSSSWSACVISDFHAYPPLGGRVVAAMDMMETVRRYSDFDWTLNLGDICAWGGSYSFWVGLYQQQQFKDCMWAGVNGNHDNMTRNYVLRNDFFRNANANPQNGYEGEEGVCYWFRYGDALFVMLNNENMRDSAGFAKAAAWTEKVLTENADAPYKIVCEHYQWFYGTDGRSSQYNRWHELFERCGVTLALAGNNHIYVRAHSKGVVYIQTPSSDNERGQDPIKPLEENKNLIDFRWNEGPHTVGALHLDVNPRKMTVTLLDRTGKVLDRVAVSPRK